MQFQTLTPRNRENKNSFSEDLKHLYLKYNNTHVHNVNLWHNVIFISFHAFIYEKKIMTLHLRDSAPLSTLWQTTPSGEHFKSDFKKYYPFSLKILTVFFCLLCLCGNTLFNAKRNASVGHISGDIQNNCDSRRKAAMKNERPGEMGRVGYGQSVQIHPRYSYK